MTTWVIGDCMIDTYKGADLFLIFCLLVVDGCERGTKLEFEFVHFLVVGIQPLDSQGL